MARELRDNFLSAVDGETNSVLLQTARFDQENHTSYLFRGPEQTLAARSLDDIPRVFAGIEAALRNGRWVAGFLSYECGAHFEPRAPRADAEVTTPEGLPLAWFGVYDSPLTLDPLVDGEDSRDEPKVSRCAAWTERADKTDLALAISAFDYRERLDRIKRYIEAGDTYQVNLTTSVKLPYTGRASDLFSALLQNQPVAFGALLNLGETQIVSASPELFFRVENGRITTRPMKGTAPRGKDLAEDAAMAEWLKADEKNRSENVMIVDLLRNDLGRICLPGSIQVDQLFAIERYRTLFQMVSAIHGQLQPGVDFYRIFKALFPSGSIVGAPKVRTMQIIGELELRRRGVYTGAIGFLSPQGNATFSVAIRTLVLRDGLAEMGVGSGIVWNSDPIAEYEECLLKASFLKSSPAEFELIETMLWEGEYSLLALHLERLAASAAYFDFRFDAERVLNELMVLGHSFGAGSRCRVRLLLNQSGVVTLSSSPLEARPGPLAVMVAEEAIDAENLYLRHKTTNRALYDRVHKEATAAGFDEAVFLNRRNEVAEGAIHNIFVEREGRWMTPPLESGALPGVFRRHLLETRPNISEQRLTLEDLRMADRIFLCNSVRGLREVDSLRAGETVLFSRKALCQRSESS